MFTANIPPANKRGQVKRRQILLAARQLFLTRGFAGTSMEAIRAAAPVSKPTLYKHFRNKEDLFAGVVSEVVEDYIADGLPSSPASARLGSREEFRQTLLGIARQALDHLLHPEYVALVRLVVAETPYFPQLGDIFRAAVPERALGLIAAILLRGKEKGLVRTIDPNIAARMLTGPLLSYLVMEGLLASGGPPRKPASTEIEIIVDMFLRAVS